VTRASPRSDAIASAIAPLPVPTSRTRGAVTPSISASARSTTISVSGRGTSARESMRSVSLRKPHSPRMYASGSRRPRRSTSARRRLRGLLSLALGLIQARTQNAHRLVAVLELRAFVLHRNEDARRQVRDAHGRVGRVDRLTARARRTEHVDLQVLVVDLHVD